MRNPIVISGDVHMAEVLTDKCEKHRLGHSLVELTSSGLTHANDHSYFTYLFAPFLQIMLADTYNVINLLTNYLID